MCRRRWMYALNHNLIKLILSAQKAYLTWLFTLLTSRNFYMKNHKSYMTKITVKTVFVLSEWTKLLIARILACHSKLFGGVHD